MLDILYFVANILLRIAMILYQLLLMVFDIVNGAFRHEMGPEGRRPSGASPPQGGTE